MGKSNIRRLSSNGNMVNVGNFDDNGLNVDNDNPRYRNDDIGFRVSRSVSKGPMMVLLCFFA